jgi:hypothetical protein
MSQLLEFLEDNSTNFKELYLSDILKFTDRDMEEKHDFIQWVFPTDEKSTIAPEIPVLDQKTIRLFKKSEIARSNLIKAKDLYLGFLYRNSHWIKLHDHNHLRITRVIKSLRLLLGNKEADDFKKNLYGILGGRISLIHENSRKYWSKA